MSSQWADLDSDDSDTEQAIWEASQHSGLNDGKIQVREI